VSLVGSPSPPRRAPGASNARTCPQSVGVCSGHVEAECHLLQREFSDRTKDGKKENNAVRLPGLFALSKKAA
jgi:hypothetical protein